jgi:site-specific DNA recombinase
MKRQVVTYIRVSTMEQAKHGYSIEAQRQVLQDYAMGNDLEIVKEFVESESAYKPGRPQFQAMLTFLKRRRSLGGVLCYKIDRIARNLQDYSALTEMMGVTIISATERLPANSTGELMGGVQAVFARYYSAQLSERVSLGLATKARKGLWPTYAPTGYVNDKAISGISPDPVSAPLIRELFENYARAGMSVKDATEWARKRGLRSRYGAPLVRSAVHSILSNPIYYGALPWKGNLFTGKHEPIISKGLFNRVQQRLHSGTSPMTQREFPYRGLLTCGYCGCSITAEIKKSKYVYYRCTFSKGKCSQPYHPQEKLSGDLLDVIAQIHISPAIVALLDSKLREDTVHRDRERKARIIQLKSEEQRIDELRDDAYVEKLEGTITEARWLSVDTRLAGRRELVQEEIHQLSSQRDTSPDNVRPTLELLERAPELYLRQNHTERARLLQTVTSNCIITADSLVPVYKTPFDAVAEGARSGNWLGEKDSNPH